MPFPNNKNHCDSNLRSETPMTMTVAMRILPTLRHSCSLGVTADNTTSQMILIPIMPMWTNVVDVALWKWSEKDWSIQKLGRSHVQTRHQTNPGSFGLQSKENHEWNWKARTSRAKPWTVTLPRRTAGHFMLIDMNCWSKDDIHKPLTAWLKGTDHLLKYLLFQPCTIAWNDVPTHENLLSISRNHRESLKNTMVQHQVSSDKRNQENPKIALKKWRVQFFFARNANL